MSQKERIIHHLQRFGSITSEEAFIRYGITRLASVIHELRHKDGYIIPSEEIAVKNRYGETCYVSRYIWND